METKTATTKRRQGRPSGQDFPHPIRLYESDEGVEILETLARERGLSTSALLRQLVREEHRRAMLRRVDFRQEAEAALPYYESLRQEREAEAAEAAA